MTRRVKSFNDYSHNGNEYWLYISSTALILTEKPSNLQTSAFYRKPLAYPGLTLEVLCVAGRSFSTDFKLEAASMVLDRKLSVAQVCKNIGVGPTALRRWVEQLRSQRSQPSCSEAMAPEQKRIQELEAQVRRLEREKEILKKAATLLMSESLNQ
jgi:transposase